MTYVLFNPLSDNKNGEANAKKLNSTLRNEEKKFIDITQINAAEFISNASADDRIIIAGGDGTIHKFVNQCGDRIPDREILYYPAGSGNDFRTELMEKTSDDLIILNPYIKNLPTVTINGKSLKFLNGIGFGIDGYCCEEGDKLRRESIGSINYAKIAIKGMLGAFKPRSAVVVADGKMRRYKYVWLAPTMKGKYYGGGMKVAPFQNRLSKNGEVTTIVFHCPSKIATLTVFPSIFKGTHVNHKKMVDMITAKEVTVKFDRPTPLQIDGETFTNVTSYSVSCTASTGSDDKNETRKSALTVNGIGSRT